MDGFMTWDTLLTFSGLVATVYMIVEFTKEVKFLKKVPTKYWSFIVASFLIICTNLAVGLFQFKNILLYLLTAVSISLGSNGLSNFNKKGNDK